jgi:L-asparaginase II
MYLGYGDGMQLQNRHTGTIIVLDDSGKLLHQIGGKDAIRKHHTEQYH